MGTDAGDAMVVELIRIAFHIISTFKRSGFRA
jgi:hypothetical protein